MPDRAEVERQWRSGVELAGAGMAEFATAGDPGAAAGRGRSKEAAAERRRGEEAPDAGAAARRGHGEERA